MTPELLERWIKTLLDEPRQWTLTSRLFRRLGGKPGGDESRDLEIRTILDEIGRLTYFDQSRLGGRIYRHLTGEPEPEDDPVERIRQQLEAEYGKDYRPRPLEESMVMIRERLRSHASSSSSSPRREVFEAALQLREGC